MSRIVENSKGTTHCRNVSQIEPHYYFRPTLPFRVVWACFFALKRNSGHRHRRQQPLFERDHIIGRTANDLAQLLQGKHSNVSIFLEGIQRVIINAALQKLVLCHIVSLHSFPQRPVINDLPHHISGLIKKLYVVF